MQAIGREELRRKLERGDEFRLVMALGEWEFRTKHIPGSIRFEGVEDMPSMLGRHEEIVVYGAGEGCAESIRAHELLCHRGFARVRRYGGGIADWEEAGLPLVGAGAADPRARARAGTGRSGRA